MYNGLGYARVIVPSTVTAVQKVSGCGCGIAGPGKHRQEGKKVRHDQLWSSCRLR